MFRILLVLEDINQLNAIKIFLTKLGCDVETQGVELGLKDQVMSFRPDIVLTGGTGKKVNPGSVAQKVREMKEEIKVITFLARGVKISLDDLMASKYDAFIEAPFDPLRLITILNKWKSKGGVDLIEKYHKLMGGIIGDMGDINAIGGATSNKNATVMGGASTDEAESRSLSLFESRFPTSVAPLTRVQNYDDLTYGIAVGSESMITKDAVRSTMLNLQKNWNQKRLDEIDKAKRQFAKELFRKK